MGWCGRDGMLLNEFILFKNYKGYLKKVECEFVKLVKDSNECRWNNLCKVYVMKKVNIIFIYNCCDVCEKKCSCDDDICFNIYKVN